MSIRDNRREYQYATLRRKSLLDDPVALFNAWLDQAITADLPDPTAMTVATVSSEGRPSQRMVLLKGCDTSGFVFYTNLGSRKAQELAGNPFASLHFSWLTLERQVMIEGHAKPLSRGEVLSYFETRPFSRQIGAWASRQSAPVESRSVLEDQYKNVSARFAEGHVPTPDFWGGFRVAPQRIEFWQGGEHRLHDRFAYSRKLQGGTTLHWDCERLSP